MQTFYKYGKHFLGSETNFHTMPNGKTSVTAHFDNDEARKLRDYMNRKGLEAQGNAVRKLTAEALSENDPRNSWMLHAGISAMLWSVLAVIGTLRIGTPPRFVTLFSILMAAVFLTAHSIQLVHAYGVGDMPILKHLFRRPERQ